MVHTYLAPRFPAENYLNRELGLLAFNRRVLAQAQDENVPLLERLRFLCIVSSNLDEFFEIRVSGLKEQIGAHSSVVTTDGKSAQETYRMVSAEAHAIVREQYQQLNDIIFPTLAEQGIRFLRRATWNEAQRHWIRDYFLREMVPVLTPIGLDPSHPFPRVLNKSLNFAIELEGKDAFGRSSDVAIVQAPRVLPRVIRLPDELTDCPYGFVFLSSILHEFVGELFTGMTVLGCYQFRVTRNSDLFVDEEEVTNLRTKLQGELPQRHFGNAVRLEVADNCSPAMTEFLLEQFGLNQRDLYRVNGPVNLVRVMQVPDWVDRPDMKFRPFAPGTSKGLSKGANIFDSIRKNDILLHHPYQSFAPVIELLSLAATDPQVVAIKMTVYRTGTDSVLMESLIRAAQNGKEVTVVVELMARFDEEANINWADALEAVGAQVVYGVVGLKTHGKMLLVTRREGKGLRRYGHLSTGNYNPKTARMYTDLSYLTCDPVLTADMDAVFRHLASPNVKPKLQKLVMAPFALQQTMLAHLESCRQAALKGQYARVVIKSNAMTDETLIRALVDAGQAGVKIDLIVRGACMLPPQVLGQTDNIRVRSIIGRLLEHSRVFYFAWGDKQEHVYLSSADWMRRNMTRRVELAWPVQEPKLRQRVIDECLVAYLHDDRDAWTQQPDGSYLPAPHPCDGHSVQNALMSLYGG